MPCSQVSPIPHDTVRFSSASASLFAVSLSGHARYGPIYGIFFELSDQYGRGLSTQGAKRQTCLTNATSAALSNGVDAPESADLGTAANRLLNTNENIVRQNDRSFIVIIRQHNKLFPYCAVIRTDCLVRQDPMSIRANRETDAYNQHREAYCRGDDHGQRPEITGEPPLHRRCR